MSIQKQTRLLDSSNLGIVVATPGRLWELLQLNDKYVEMLSKITTLVIDEADRMLEAGHFKELANVLKAVIVNNKNNGAGGDKAEPRKRKLQKLLFSATLDSFANAKLSESNKNKNKNNKSNGNSLELQVMKMLQFDNTKTFTIINTTHSANNLSSEQLDSTQKDSGTKNPKIKEFRINCMEKDKEAYLYMFLSSVMSRGQNYDFGANININTVTSTSTSIDGDTNENGDKIEKQKKRKPTKTLVFVNSISSVRRLVPILSLLNIKAYPLHAQMQQRQRLKNLDRFRTNNVKSNNNNSEGEDEGEDVVLVASDVAARGLDVIEIDNVVHYHVPKHADLYIHRSGRTGRSHNSDTVGRVVIFVTPQEQSNYKKLCTTLGMTNNKESTGIEIPKYSSSTFSFNLVDKYKEIVNVAMEIDKVQHARTKQTFEANWYHQNANQMDIELDPQFVGHNAGNFNDDDDDDDSCLVFSSNGKATKKSKNNNNNNNNNKDKNKNKNKNKNTSGSGSGFDPQTDAKLQNLKSKLSLLLSKPILPPGFLSKYITSGRSVL
ncbi:ATP-dependent RNA helicase MAK5 [Zancudomyces culisetae]|uniref:ATP-dependent RNA helicase n=1 Tax=Zancudomyces culisetae TaxID=1213189 RepID=A0A1R1PV22_ZANCU|nr:ATP-dependent RNA helicase MAK5 [Zancudomyces culisetae]|eukprot:OMH84783.1 ATP-dependent RNA helicase MAK5 [Zancudomyces culisetae]